jgi:predicted phage baseplate assembly protein
VLVQDEQVGTSDGQVYQAYRLALPFLASTELGEPVTCQVTVGGRPWTYKPGLLDLKGHHFAVEPRLSVIYFGDGERGRIPAGGIQIAATYRATDGVAGNVLMGTALSVDERSKLLPPAVKKALDSGVSFTIRCTEDASGGAGPTGLSEAREMVREDFRTLWRSVTESDFAQIALDTPGLDLARAICVPEMDLSASDPFAARPGHVSVIVVPRSEADRPEPSADCLANTWDHLDTRRVITCRHHVVGPAYTEVKIEAEVMRTARSQAETVQSGIEENLRAFFHPLTGGPDGEKKGWPFGRDVYASEVYQVIENTEGVDHVESLSLQARKNGDWGEPTDQVVIPLHSLVYWSYQAGDVEVRIVH